MTIFDGLYQAGARAVAEAFVFSFYDNIHGRLWQALNGTGYATRELAVEHSVQFLTKPAEPTKPKLTEDEEIFVQWAVELSFKYLAREQCGDLWIYEYKPTKGTIWSHNVDTNAAKVNTDKYPFSFVKWEDAEPTYLPDLLGDCE